MPTQNPKHRHTTRESEQEDQLPLQEHDLEPTKEQSEQLRGGVLPPSDLRGVYITPPGT